MNLNFNYIYYSLLNVRYGSLLGPRGLLLMYMWGENSDRENPVIHLPAFGTRLLGACLAPAGRLWYSTSLLFGHLGNHCCRNKPTDALVSFIIIIGPYSFYIKKGINIYHINIILIGLDEIGLCTSTRWSPG